MDPLLPVAVASWVAAFFLGPIHARRRAAGWRHAAQQAGLENVRETTTWYRTLSDLRGDANGLQVDLSNSRHGTRIVVLGDGQIARCVRMRAGGINPDVRKLFGGKNLELGDPHFDLDVRAEGPEDALLPLLDNETRSAVLAVVGFGGHIADDAVELEVGDSDGREGLTRALMAALHAAQGLRHSDDAVARMTAIARNDPVADVRRRYLTYLARNHPEHRLAHEAFREALQSTDARTRIGTAVALGAHLTAALVALAAIPDPLAEPTLTTVLASEDADLRVLAVEALGQVGTIVSVAALRAAVEAHGDLKRAARQAIAAIQARLPGASPGQVSLAEGESGQVSLASGAEAGQVSLAPEGSDAP